MASITIRRLDESVKSKLRVRAAQHHRSMEEEAREILRSALTAKKSRNLAEAMHAPFEAIGGVKLPKIRRELPRPLPHFK
jgi:antitoxin FitA